MAKVKVEIDDKTYKRVKKVVESFGLDLPSVTRAFYTQIVREQGIPLNLSGTAAPTAAAEAPVMPVMPVAAALAVEAAATPAAPAAQPAVTASATGTALEVAPVSKTPAKQKAVAQTKAAPSAPATGMKAVPAPATATAAPSAATPAAAPSQNELMARMREAMEAEAGVERTVLEAEGETLEEDACDSAVEVIAETPYRSVTVGVSSKSKKDGDEGSWRDNWLFEDDDSEDDLLFSPYEF